jgi:phage portal protein BeeE
LLYSIFIPSPSGDLVEQHTKGPGAAVGPVGASSYFPPPLGNAYSDAYRGQKAATPAELIQQLVGTVYACADLNAGAVAANPLRLMVRTRKGQRKPRWRTSPIRSQKMLNHARLAYAKAAPGNDPSDGELEELTDPEHPLLQLLAKPTQDPNGIGSYDLRYCTQLYLESVARAYWWLRKDGMGMVKEIWLLRAHMVREVPDYDGEQLIAYFQYGRQRIPPDEIIRFHLPDPYSLYFGGLSPTAAAIEKIRIARKQDAHVAALLDNMGRPDALLIPKGGSEGDGIGESEARRWRQMMQAEFRRAGRGGLAVSEFPGQLEVLGWKPADIGEIEREKGIKTDVMNVFGVPDALLERNAANLASAKTAEYAHAKYAVLPRTTRTAEVLNQRLIPLFDDSGRLLFVFDNPVPDDELFELEQTKALAGTGALTIDEQRAGAGLEKLGPENGGDKRYLGSLVIDEDGDAADTATVLSLQSAYYAGTLPRDAAIANAVQTLGLDKAEAAKLFPEKMPDAPGAVVQQQQQQEAHEQEMAQGQGAQESGGGGTGGAGGGESAPAAPSAPTAETAPEPTAEELYPIGGKAVEYASAYSLYMAALKAGQFDDSKHPHGEGGRFEETRGGRKPTGRKPGQQQAGGGTDGKVTYRTAHQKPTAAAKAALAKRKCFICDKSVTRYADANEAVVAKKLGGLSFRDSEAVDVVLGQGGRVEHGIEIKTIVANKEGKIKMKPTQIRRKMKWSADNKAEISTLVIDDSAVKDAKGPGQHDFSKRVLYYRRGVGGFRFAGMQKVKNYGQLKKLLAMSVDELPDAAKPPKGYKERRRGGAKQQES